LCSPAGRQGNLPERIAAKLHKHSSNKMTTEIIKTKKGIVEFSLKGRGIPLLFVHGGHSSSTEVLFHKDFDTNRFCLITPSRPGYGNTPLSDNVTPKDTAELFNALLDELKIDSLIVIGISAGGLCAIELAARFPNRVAKLILISAITKKWMTEKDKNYIRAKKLFSPTIEKYSWGLFRFFYTLFPMVMAKTMFKELSSYKIIDVSKDEISELFEMIRLQRSKEGFINDLEQDSEPYIISNIKCPAIILHSFNDNTVKMEHAKYGHTQIKNSILKIYNNKWGHLLWLGEESNMPINDTLNFIDKE
jgi:pimeloyl-ACP methyl ester carboxylesterase